MGLTAERRVLGDWCDAVVPECVALDDEAYLESAFSFSACRARATNAIRIARGAHVYSSTIFDVGPAGDVSVGVCSMLSGARLVCEARIEIGAYATISWNVVFMDCYRLPFDPRLRRECLERAARHPERRIECAVPGRPIRLCDNVWIGFDVCVLPGVTIGEGAVVGARSVVAENVPAYTVVAGNPARAIRRLIPPEGPDPFGASP